MLLSLFIGNLSPPLEQIANSNKAVQLVVDLDQFRGRTWRKIGDDYIHINAIAPGVSS